MTDQDKEPLETPNGELPPGALSNGTGANRQGQRDAERHRSSEEDKIPSMNATRYKQKSETANFISKTIVIAFAIGLLGCFGITLFILYEVFVNAENPCQLNDVSPIIEGSFESFETLAAVFAGPLGFILGFYFKEYVQSDGA